MRYLITKEGKLIQASDLVAEEMLKRGARELKLKQIETPLYYGNETRGGAGISEIPKPRRSRKPRNGEREISTALDGAKGTRRNSRKT
jgi:hypothetical protein